MYNNFGLQVTKILKKAEEERLLLHHPYVGTEHLLLAILELDKDMADFFSKYNLTYEKFKKELILVVGMAKKNSDINLYTPLLKRVICNALENARENNSGLVTSKHLILSILEEGEGIAIRLLLGMGIDIDDVYELLNKSEKITNKKLQIYETGVLLNETISKNEVVVGRDKEIDSIIETILRKKKNNPILIGDAGVGKTAIVEELVRRIEKKEVPESLFNTKIVSLEMGSLVSGTKYRGEFEEKLTKIIKELEENPNIILFIDEIHSMVSAGGAEGAITAGDIFKPALARGKIKCIGATTTYEYNKFFSNDKALMRRFEVINVCEPTLNETKNILLKVKNEYEMHHGVVITNEIIDRILFYTDRFIKQKKNPDKAIDFLDSVCSRVKNNNINNDEKRKIYKEIEKINIKKEECIKENNYELALKLYKDKLKLEKQIKKYDQNHKIIIKEKDIISVLENKTNMIFTKEKLNFLNEALEEISKELFNSEKYLKKINNIIKDNLLNYQGYLKIGLEGPIGVGKSSMIKKLASYFPKTNFIRIDLKEFTEVHDVSKLLGTTKGYVGYNDDHLLTSIKSNLFSIILFDNYNAAHQNVKDIIKEILKEGYITDNKGDKIYFNNTLIFITNDIDVKTNIGFTKAKNLDNSNDLRDYVDEMINIDALNEEELRNYLESKNILNIDKIIKESEYEKYNYKKLDKLIKEDNLIKN